jgi:hypothetical protein
MSKSETRKATLKTLWGDVQHPKIRYRCAKCSHSLSLWEDPSLDSSDCTPLVLSRMQEFALHVPYRISSQFMRTWGVDIRKSEIAELSQTLELEQYALSHAYLELLAVKPLNRIGLSVVTGLPRLPITWMLEIDGTLVPTRVIEADGQVRVEYREIKSAVLYQKNTPSERYQISALLGVEAFTPLVLGLLRFAGVSLTDRLVGLSDGAAWIASIFADACVNVHILDVFHAAEYFETVLLGLGWNEAARGAERGRLLRGEIDMRSWLNFHITPSRTQALALEPNGTLKLKVSQALAYLEKQTELLHTTYPRFKALGLEVIGSGEIEGANKSVIGARLKVSGAQWSEVGANAKSFARGVWSSVRGFVSFEELRFKAFPRAA